MDRCSKIHLALNTAINRVLRKHAPRNGTLLDIGCWDGGTTMTYAHTVEATTVLGVEFNDSAAAAARARGMTVLQADIERDNLDLPSASVDLVVCNQVFEHLKNIFHPLDEIARVLRSGGLLVISVPNLASFHNRCMLALGLQPSSIRIWGPHVRGFVASEFRSFCLTGGAFTHVQTTGVGFYPLSPRFGGNLLAQVWRNASHTPVWVFRRATSIPRFQSCYEGMDQQTVM